MPEDMQKSLAAAETASITTRKRKREQVVLDPSQVLLSCKALTSFISKSCLASRSGDTAALPVPLRPVWLSVTTPIIPDSAVLKPALVRVPRPVFGDAPAACVILRDRRWEGLLKLEGVIGRYAAATITLTKVKALRRLEKECLAEQYDLFIATDSVVFRAASVAMGTVLAEKKRALLPVQLKQGELKKAVKDACRSTLVHLNHGGCTSIRIGHTGMAADDLAENILAATDGVVSQVPGGWKRVNALHLRSQTSVPLPVYVRKKEGAEEGNGERGMESTQTKRSRGSNH